MPLAPEVKAEFVKTLRSGKYAQGLYCLRKRLPNDTNFCCVWGVFLDTFEPDIWHEVTNNKWEDLTTEGEILYCTDENQNNVSMIPHKILEKYNLDYEKVREYILKNDDKVICFDELADMIEKDQDL